MKVQTRTYLLLEVTHSKDVPDLVDKVAQRIYVIDGVDNTSAILLDTGAAYKLAQAQKDRQ